MKIVRCHKCNAVVKPEDKVCKSCGAVLKNKKKDELNITSGLREEFVELISESSAEVVSRRERNSKKEKLTPISPPSLPSLKKDVKVIYFSPPKGGFFSTIIYGLRSQYMLNKQKQNLQLISNELQKLKNYESRLLYQVGKTVWEKEILIPEAEDILKRIELKLQDIVEVSGNKKVGKEESKKVEKFKSEIKEYEEKLSLLIEKKESLEKRLSQLKEQLSQYEDKLNREGGIEYKLVEIELGEIKDKYNRLNKQYNKILQEIENIEDKIKERKEYIEGINKERKTREKLKLRSYKVEGAELITIFKELGREICERGIPIEGMVQFMRRYRELKKIVREWENLRAEQQKAIFEYSPSVASKGWLYFWILIILIIVMIGVGLSLAKKYSLI